MRHTPALILTLLAYGSACASAAPPKSSAAGAPRAAATAAPVADPYPSTYRPAPSETTLIRGATILTATGPRIENGSILLRDGKVEAVGASIEAPAAARVIDATGKWVTPGIIDVHSHLGVYPSPEVDAHSDGNEMTDPVTADVRAEHSIWPQDPQFPLARAGGVTSMLILPGSANLIGGVGVALKNVPGRTMQEMKFPGAPYGLKMACGENPKRVYGSRNRMPMTRMGNLAATREAWIGATEYRQKWREYTDKIARGQKGRDGQDPDPPDRDLKKETLAKVLSGEILVQNHCYRADEMALMIDQAKEFGYKISAFHHAVESYKIADLLAKEGICSAMWADWWGFKMEALDGIRENVALVERAGACAIVHSDSADGIQRLNQEAAKAMAAGNRLARDEAAAGHPGGKRFTQEDAIRWITINPAQAMGVGDRTGSLEPGKMADVVIWSGDPFSVYARAEQVFVDGARIYDRNDPEHQQRTDFELGLRDVRTGNPGGGK
jgi:imidazolonepropionase-like amidohydrolase